MDDLRTRIALSADSGYSTGSASSDSSMGAIAQSWPPAYNEAIALAQL